MLKGKRRNHPSREKKQKNAFPSTAGKKLKNKRELTSREREQDTNIGQIIPA
jgi:hypothetical protein